MNTLSISGWFYASFDLQILFLSKRNRTFLLHMFAKWFDLEGGSQSLQSFALFLLVELCSSLWALTMSENSMSIQSRDVYTLSPWPQRIRQKDLSADAAFQAVICNGGPATCFIDLLGQKLENKAIFSRRKRVLVTPPIENNIFYLFIWFPFSFTLQNSSRGKFVSFSSVLDTVVHNLYVNYRGIITPVVRRWMASKRKV